MSEYLAMYLLCGLCMVLPIIIKDRDNLTGHAIEFLMVLFFVACWPVGLAWLICDDEAMR